MVSFRTPSIVVFFVASLSIPSLAIAGGVDCNITETIGTINTPTAVEDITISGSRAYLALGPSGLQIYDISNPTSLVLLGTYDTPGYAGAVEILGNTAFVADGGLGLQIIDVTDPTTPTLLSSIGSGALNVSLEGEIAYIVSVSHIESIDISDPTSPTTLESGTLLFNKDVTVKDNIAYITWRPLYSGGINLIDVSDPTSLPIIGSYNDGGQTRTETPNAVTVAGNMAYIADVSFGLRIINVSDPTAPFLMSLANTPGTALNVTISGTTAFVADSEAGIQIFDVSNPSLPVLINSYNMTPDVNDISIDGNNAYVATSQGITVLDISNCSFCSSDLNDDGKLNFFDISTFLSSYAAQDPIADFTGDGLFNFFDVSVFLAAFATGCP